jgi:O-antigen biosynthesis protein
VIESNRERQAPQKSLEAEPSHLARYKFVLNFIKTGDIVLDLPCGTGYGSEVMSTKAREVVGIDIGVEAIHHAKEFFRNGKTKFMIGNAENLQNIFPTNEIFDVIVSFEGIEHLNNQDSFLQEIKRLLKKEGQLIISTPRKPHGSPYHTIEFSLEEFRTFLSKEFVVEKMYGQIYTDIFDLEKRKENPHEYKRFNFIAICKKA